MSSLFHFSVFFSQPSSGLPKHSLEFHFYLPIILLNISLCIDVLVIAIGIALYIYYLLQSTDVIISLVWIKYRNLTSLYVPLPSLFIIAQNTFSIYRTTSDSVILCFKCQTQFRKLKEKESLFYLSKFLLTIFSSFLMFLGSFFFF